MSEETTVECSLCGRNGEPPASCGMCHGGAGTRDRAYTLSEERSGRAPTEERYGASGATAPKTSPLVVGGALVNPSNPQNR